MSDTVSSQPIEVSEDGNGDTALSQPEDSFACMVNDDMGIPALGLDESFETATSDPPPFAEMDNVLVVVYSREHSPFTAADDLPIVDTSTGSPSPTEIKEVVSTTDAPEKDTKESIKKGKQRAEGDENQERPDVLKRRRHSSTPILLGSSVMNARPASPTFSDASSLSSLSDDDMESPPPKRKPAKKRRRIIVDDDGDGDNSTREPSLPTVNDNQLSEASSSPSDHENTSATERARSDSAICAEMRGFLIQAMALSRVSSMPTSVLLREVQRAQPHLSSQRSKDEWLNIIEDTLCHSPGCDVFGRIDRKGKDAANKPLEAQWFYKPEKDDDQDRAMLLMEMMPKKRAATRTHKQYYYKPLAKISWWDDEDEL